jgi:DNA-binding NarL/FixJ family response regulator
VTHDTVIRILIAADVRLYREGLAQLLQGHAGIEIVGAACDPEEALETVRSLHPDVLLIDRTMRGSLSAMRRAREQAPAIKVVALTVAEVDQEVLACAEAGATGFVARDGSVADLIAAVEAAQRGELCCSPRMAGSLLRRVSVLAREGPATPRLTDREGQVLRYLERGLTNQAIAQALGIEVPTVKNHVHSILEKLRVKRRGEAASVWRRNARQDSGEPPAERRTPAADVVAGRPLGPRG